VYTERIKTAADVCYFHAELHKQQSDGSWLNSFPVQGSVWISWPFIPLLCEGSVTCVHEKLTNRFNDQSCCSKPSLVPWTCYSHERFSPKTENWAEIEPFLQLEEGFRGFTEATNTSSQVLQWDSSRFTHTFPFMIHSCNHKKWFDSCRWWSSTVYWSEPRLTSLSEPKWWKQMAAPPPED